MKIIVIQSEEKETCEEIRITIGMMEMNNGMH